MGGSQTWEAAQNGESADQVRGEMTLPPLDAWKVENLRLTAFYPSGAKIDPSTWWTDLIGYPPEKVLSRPKMGHLQQDGVFEGKRLVLQVQPERVDWNLRPPVLSPEEEESDILPIVGSLPDVLNSFLDLMFRWLQIQPPITRLAFGAILLQPVQDLRAGYITIGEYLPYVKVDPDRSSEFSYQINRPRDCTSGIEGLRINRLTRWSVAKFGFGSIGISLGRELAASVGVTQERFACRLELDINTSPDFRGELPQERLPGLFQELVELGQEIAAKGDIP